jgi:hypothetical protein
VTILQNNKMKAISINESGNLIFTMDDDTVFDAGYVIGSTGPRGFKGDKGVHGAPGYDSTQGTTGPTGSMGSSLVCIQTNPDARSFTIIMSDDKRISVPLNAFLPDRHTGPTGDSGVGVDTVVFDDTASALKTIMTDGTVRAIKVDTHMRVLSLRKEGTMPVYYDPVTASLFAVRN